jgi:hypothetical protein
MLRLLIFFAIVISSLILPALVSSDRDDDISHMRPLPGFFGKSASMSLSQRTMPFAPVASEDVGGRFPSHAQLARASSLMAEQVFVAERNWRRKDD